MPASDDRTESGLGSEVGAVGGGARHSRWAPGVLVVAGAVLAALAVFVAPWVPEGQGLNYCADRAWPPTEVPDGADVLVAAGLGLVTGLALLSRVTRAAAYVALACAAVLLVLAFGFVLSDPNEYCSTSAPGALGPWLVIAAAGVMGFGSVLARRHPQQPRNDAVPEFVLLTAAALVAAVASYLALRVWARWDAEPDYGLVQLSWVLRVAGIVVAVVAVLVRWVPRAARSTIGRRRPRPVLFVATLLLALAPIGLLWGPRW